MARTLNLQGTLSELRRSDLLIEENQFYWIKPYEWRVFDALQTVLPTTAASDDLGFYPGTLGTDFPTIMGLTAGSALQQKARALIDLPPEYVAADNVKLYAFASMQAAANNTATIDFNCYSSDGDMTVTQVHTAGSAKTINSTSWAAVEFELTVGGLSPGSILDIEMIVDIDDSTAVANKIARILVAGIKADIRG